MDFMFDMIKNLLNFCKLVGWMRILYMLVVGVGIGIL